MAWRRWPASTPPSQQRCVELEENLMTVSRWLWSLPIAAGLALAGAGTAPAEAQAPKRGGIFKFVVPDEPPSLDAHRETTFALIHPVAPFYSVLIRPDPEAPGDSTKFVCDLCTSVPTPTDGGKTYTFKIKRGVKFHDGSALTAKDVQASFQRIVFPKEGISSARKAQMAMIASVEAPDDETVVFKLKHPSGAFIPALASPFHWIYSKAKLDADPRWYEKNVMGSGPFVFEKREAGATITGKKNPNYHVADRPYVDGFEAIFAKTQTLRVQAIRGDQATMEFRGFPPKSRDDLVAALGKDITVQESDWNCVLLFTANHEKKPFDDVRVRRALTLAVDRWGGAGNLSKIAIVKTVGGVVFPGHPLATPKAELEKLAGYWPDIKKSREEAKRLLKEAGQENLKFVLHNRGVDQPYTIVATWLIDQWKQVGITVEQKVEATGPFYAALNSGAFDVTMDFNCQSVVNPLSDTSKFLPTAGDQYGRFKDETLAKLHKAMNETADVEEQKKLMRQYEKRVLDEEAHNFISLWWYRIIPHRSYVKGWKISPSHYIGNQLDTVWLDK
jgi:peptide/nickel transport system substrate-binding protein